MTIAEQIARFSIDDCVYPEGGTLGPRVQSSLQLFYVYGGECRVQVDGDERRVGAGEITLLQPGHVEKFLFAGSGRTHHGYCSALGAVLSERQLCDYRRMAAVFPLPARIRELTGWAKSLNAREDRPAHHVYEAIGRLVFLEFFLQVGHPGRSAPLPEPVARVRDLVLARYADPLDLAAMARTACITPTHLVRLFRRHLSVTPVEYLWRVRTENGRRLLEETGLGVAEIAFRCGFNAPYHFARRFKALCGTTPKAYRRERWLR